MWGDPSLGQIYQNDWKNSKKKNDDDDDDDDISKQNKVLEEKRFART